MKIIGYAAKSAEANLEPFEFERRQLQPHDVLIEILYCGLCHSDVHYLEDEWKITNYPIVAGHEVIGKVIKVGSQVTTYKIGDIVIPHGIIETCGHCYECLHDLEQYCQNGYSFMYNTPDKYMGGVNYGGFSKYIVAHENYTILIPEKLRSKNLAALAPLACAGITAYSPLKHLKIGKGHKVAIVGIGGLGHMAVKFAHAFGAQVTAITTSSDKIEDIKRFGAHDVIILENIDDLKKYQNSFDFILDFLPVSHDLDPYLRLLKRDGTMVLIGRYQKPDAPLSCERVIEMRRSLTGSVLGSMQQVREMLDFCAKHDILTDVQVIPMQEINKAIENVKNKKARYRYVVDMSSI